MSIERVDHADGSTTFEAPLHGYRIPPVAQIAGEQEERERARRRAIIEAQRRTLPEPDERGNINIGPTGRLAEQRYADFLRALVGQGIAATRRNLEKLRAIDDDPALAEIDVGLHQLAENLAAQATADPPGRLTR